MRCSVLANFEVCDIFFATSPSCGTLAATIRTIVHKLNNRKILNIFYLIFSNFVLFYCIYKLFFSTNIFGIKLNLLLSLSCLNFAIISFYKFKTIERKQILYLISEWVLGFLLISFFTKFFFIRSSEYQFTYWTSMFFASLLGGFLTILNYNKTFNGKTDFKKYTIYLVLLSLFFPLINFTFYNFLYQKVFYDLNFFTIIPEILIILSWQIFTLLYVKKGFS